MQLSCQLQTRQQDQDSVLGLHNPAVAVSAAATAAPSADTHTAFPAGLMLQWVWSSNLLSHHSDVAASVTGCYTVCHIELML